MADLELLAQMLRRTREDYNEAGLAVGRARDRHDALHRDLLRLEAQYKQARESNQPLKESVDGR